MSDGPSSLSRTGAVEGDVVHVPVVHSTEYARLLGTGKFDPGGADDEILAGCVCASCGGVDLRLTLRWVERTLVLVTGSSSLRVRLARCADCKARERVLPYDALPGKQWSIASVMEGVLAFALEGRTEGGVRVGVAAAARRAGVSRQLLTHWLAGLEARGGDLFALLRHRALIAPPTAAAPRRLVRFAAFSVEARRVRGLAMSTEPVQPLAMLLELVAQLGGTLEAARLGAEQFRQAVLLFRPPPTGTSICGAPEAHPSDDPAHDPATRSEESRRYQVIEAALDPELTRAGRAALLRQIGRTPLRWPSGEDRRPSLATLYRWIQAFEANGLTGLRPKARKDKGKRRAPLPEAVVEAVLRALQDDPDQSWTFLLAVLEADFPHAEISRSTLHRRVSCREEYKRLRRSTKRHRRRFVAREPHKRWQADSKGPFDVRLASGVVISVHVLSILCDATRAVLAARLVERADLAAAVLTFRLAAERWGLCEHYYADKASIFDAHAFRAGLADLGCHRIATRAGNAPARGKIEAYHRVLSGWFVKRLHCQVVVDLVHLQQLLDGVIEGLYQRRTHRGIRMAPAAALDGRVSTRQVPRSRLHEVFLEEKRKKAHRVTGEVDLQDATWLVPEHLRGQRLTFLLDPPRTFDPLVIEPGTGHRLPLERAAVRPEDLPPEPEAQPERWGEGPLQKLYDAWTGNGRPQAEPGFGLPEIYQLLADLTGRHVPATEHEAALVQRAYRVCGPLARKPTEAAFAEIERQLGAARPLKTYLDALAQRVHPTPPKPKRRRRKRR